MSKLTLVLALYAAGLVTYVVFFQPAGAATSGGGEPAAADAEGAWRREVVDRARLEARAEIQPTLKELEGWKARIDAIRAEMQDELADLDQWIEETAQLSAGGLDDLKKRLAGLSGFAPRLELMRKEVDLLTRRVEAVEDRPATVIREVVRGGTTKPEKPKGPKVPTLPEAPVEDPAVVQQKVDKALLGLASDEPSTLWAAINTVRKYEVLAAAPRLIEILEQHKKVLMQKTAAQALGAIKSADAVLPLTAAIAGHDDALGQIANQAVRDITGFESGLEDGARIKARRRAKNAIIAWWRQHETEVRTRLGQP